MGWKDFDLFDLEKDEFSRSFQDLVLPIFQDSEASFNKRSQAINIEFDVAKHKVSAEHEMEEVGAWADHRKHVLGQQKEVVGAALLNVVCSALCENLDSMGRYFATSHPRGKYGGRSRLDKRQAEFKSRFGIDFEAAPVDFTRIRELIFARNAGVHGGAGTLKTYRENIRNPRFLVDGSLAFTRKSFEESFKDCNEFLQWVWDKLKQIRSKIGAKVVPDHRLKIESA
jgi:hypothetical protein